VATKKYFTSKRVSGITKVNTGTNTYTVNIPFTPNFIEVTFVDQQHQPQTDTVTFALAVVPTGYQLTVTYVCHEPREIRHVVAHLPIDPELTIAH
jgi:hypothetical protein